MFGGVIGVFSLNGAELRSGGDRYALYCFVRHPCPLEFGPLLIRAPYRSSPLSPVSPLVSKVSTFCVLLTARADFAFADYAFGVSSERLSRIIRVRVFAAILRQDVSLQDFLDLYSCSLSSYATADRVLRQGGELDRPLDLVRC